MGKNTTWKFVDTKYVCMLENQNLHMDKHYDNRMCDN